MLSNEITQSFLAILSEELIAAMGCTEPIALAYAAARGRAVLGGDPEFIKACCSGNIIKNVRCVRIPNSRGMTGIEAACALGALAGDDSRLMEVLEAVTAEGLQKTVHFLSQRRCRVEYLDSPTPLHFILELSRGSDTVSIEVRHHHLGITAIRKNGVLIYENADCGEIVQPAERSHLNIENIYAFANEVDIDLIRPYALRQIQCNMAISERGMAGDYGLGIGKAILKTYPDCEITKAKAYTAAASEARMDGCDMPVIITSGSGNQGIASTVPVIVYARERGIPDEQLYRCLIFSSLLTIFQKEYLGKLSAFCGAVSASCAAGAAITYMLGGTVQQIKDTIDNTLADIPGILCDGAKASCAAKIASALDAALLAHSLAMDGKVYEANSGILQDDAGHTISSVGYIGKVGMKQTDAEIVKMMIRKA
ncbi:MAG: serine dehydratase subunit alpha family protein [Oscillospiraceae bacterium]|nr:serine dehydratase subunit alpha family protein [Oscillospiraceae bacterium]